MEEETLSHRKAQVQEIEQSLTEALQKKKVLNQYQELKALKTCPVISLDQSQVDERQVGPS